MPDWLLQLLGMAVTAGAIYGSIRSDLKNARQCAEEAKAAAGRAHERIDNLLVRG